MRFHIIDGRDEPFQGLKKWYGDLERVDRGGRAALRRCDRAEQVALLPAYHALVEALGVSHGDASALEGVARVALCAARLTLLPDDPNLARGGTLATALRGQGEQSGLSPLRFQRLMEADDPEDIVRQLRRAIDLLKGKASLRDVADAAFDFNPALRKRWALDFYRDAVTRGNK